MVRLCKLLSHTQIVNKINSGELIVIKKADVPTALALQEVYYSSTKFDGEEANLYTVNHYEKIT